MSIYNVKDNIPELEIVDFSSHEIQEKYADLINRSRIKELSKDIEVWTSSASNKTLSYLSHGIFRYFGKFPPPIARHAIKEYTKENDLVIDPMCGSGTTALEALLLKRQASCFDINPLSVLISRVKTTKIDKEDYLQALNEVRDFYTNSKRIKKPVLTGLRNPDHWFLPETIISLEKIRTGVKNLSYSSEIKDALMVAFLGIVRRVSRATTQQGRLFLDVETAEKDAFPFFLKKALEIAESAPELPKTRKSVINIEVRSIFDTPNSKDQVAKLIICHPPYFNSYKYSGVNSLELAWLDIDHASIRKGEIREAFKVGKPEKVEEYLNDMENGLRNLNGYLESDGRVVLMIGDTVIKGQYIPVTHNLIHRLKDVYNVEKVALRIPKFTEASWAASQRRKGGDVGINLCDLMVILKKT